MPRRIRITIKNGDIVTSHIDSIDVSGNSTRIYWGNLSDLPRAVLELVAELVRELKEGE